MARLDGNEAALSREAIENHLAACADCRDEVEQMEKVDALFRHQQRREHAVNVWPVVQAEIVRKPIASPISASAVPFIVLGVLLLGYRLFELIPGANFSLVIKLIPVLMVVAVFAFIKENPFKINSRLRLEGEGK
jgi:predicted anti-sigma-YlaC factor YlaD